MLSPGPVPTTDIYLGARSAAEDVRVVDTLSESPGGAPIPGSDLVVVRHAPRRWLRWVGTHRVSFRRIALLMDDDMPRALQAVELPLSYAWRTARRIRDTSCGLAGACDELWLSTPELLARYPGERSRLCEPLYVATETQAPEVAESEPVYFYHGTRAHQNEIRWLVPVVARVQERCGDAVFEVFGDAEVRRLFSGIPRVRVRPWLSWRDYLLYCARHRYRVGLAPCLDTPFNRARAPVKFFDITRLGAVGVYADLAPYAGMVRPGETGLLCAERGEEWVESVVALLSAPDRARAMAGAARESCERHRQSHAHWPPYVVASG